MLKLAGCLVILAACLGDSCPVSVETYCADGKCPLTWDAAHDPASWGCTATSGPRVYLATCGNVHVATRAGVDTANIFYYDANGKLYRVERTGVSSRQCEAGGGDEKTCEQNIEGVCPPP